VCVKETSGGGIFLDLFLKRKKRKERKKEL
jgi:hypothetical protein